MNPTAIYSKSGKGVQEAAGKTSLLKRPDRAVLAVIDGRATLADVAQKVGKTFDPAFRTLITQLDKDGFIREVSSGAAAAAPAAKPAAPAAKAPPPKPAAKPAATAPMDAASDLDFSSLGAPSKPSPASAPPKEQQSALNKAREEAEARAQAERDRLKKEAEAKTRAEMEAKLRAEAEKKLKEEAESKAKADADAKVKAAREAAVRAAAEAKAKVEAEAKTKLDAERKAREETERKLAEERKAREEAERKAKEEGERARKEAEEKARREAEELRQRLEEERKAREAAERKAKEEAERARKELEEERKRLEEERKREDEERAARRKREDEEEQARRKQKEEEERKAEDERAAKRKEKEEKERLAEEERAAKKKQREEEEAVREREEQAQREAERAAKKKQREEEEAERERQEEAERAAKKKQREEERHKAEAGAAAAAPSAPKAAAPAPKAEAKKDSFSDSLLADLDSFTSHDEEDAKAKEEAERKAKAARQEAEHREREESERKAKEESERKAKEEAERRKREAEERRREEEEARQAQEDERRKREAEEIRRKAEAATAAAMAKEGKSPPKAEDIPVTEDDLDMDEVKRERAALAKAKPKEEREEPRKPEKKKKKEKVEEFEAAPRRPLKLGKPIAMGLIALLVVAVGVLHVMPIGTADYERVATEALGRPVKIGGARLWLLTGVQLRFTDVSIGDAKIAHVIAHASPGSITGDKKEFSSIELDGLTLPQEALADALFARVQGDNFTVERIVVKSLALPGPATLPKSLQADMTLDAKGAMRSATVRGPDGLVAKLVPKDDGFEFDVIAAGFTLPIAPQVVLSNFGMKGTATPRGMQISEWGGAIFGGAISGTANMRWGSSWNVDGVFTVRSINAAVFAPALLSAGSAEGTGKFTMNAADPSNLMSASRVDGNFTVNKGTLGSFDLARAIQTGGKQFSGTTPFAEMNGQGTYDRGAVALRNVTIGAGALNAGASADISQSGALSGRIVADMKTAAQTLRGTLLLGGTVKEPQVRN